jgi:hypothetical protein
MATKTGATKAASTAKKTVRGATNKGKTKPAPKPTKQATAKAKPAAKRTKQATAKAKPAAKRTKRAAPTTKQSVLREYDKQLKAISRDIDWIGKKAAEVVAQTEKEYKKLIVDLYKRRTSLEREVGRIRKISDTAFHDVTGSAESAVNDLRKGVSKALSRFR